MRYDGAGSTVEPYFELRVPMEGTPTDFDVSSNLYSRLGDSQLKAGPVSGPI
jgi:hypothetical protein